MTKNEAMQLALQRQDTTYKALKQASAEVTELLATEDGKSAILAYERYTSANAEWQAANKRLLELENMC